jgi:hypothetical protein
VNEELEEIRMDIPPTCSDGLREMMKNFSHNSLHVRPRSYLATTHIQGVSRLVDITAGGDFLGLCDQKKFI